jgi:hypothetical protein
MDMRKHIWTKLLAITVACAAVSNPLTSGADQGRGRGRGQDANAAIARRQDDPGRSRGGSSRIYQDAASLKGYESGRDLGLLDGRDGERYDPVRHRDYRDADRGYASSYGSRDGYKTKFRAGFRQGYEDGYREGTRTTKK